MGIGLIESEIARVKIGDMHPVRLMGVINLSQESFYKGSVVKTKGAALTRAQEMVEEGAEMLDIGAMSTAPKVKHKSYSQEKSTLMPILKQLVDNIDVPISIDTYRSKIADAALGMGAHVINDISGFTKDPKLVEVLQDHDAPSIIMATDKKPGDPHSINEITKALLKSIHLAERKGYDTDKITIDPGIGLWVPTKVYKYNLDIINNLERFRCIGKPILVGISRKSFIGDVLGKPNPFDRLQGTLAATAIAVYNGAHIVRTHDVRVTAEIVKLSQRVRGRPVGVEEGGYEVRAIENMQAQDSVVAMKAVGAAVRDAKAMSEKVSFKSVLINNLSSKEIAVIRKQMVKLGGEVAGTSRANAKNRVDLSVIIFGTVWQLKQLSAKLRSCEPAGLKKVGKLVRKVLRDEDLEFRYKYGFE